MLFETDRAIFMESYKLYVMGAGGVGKSAITIQLVQGRFAAAYDPTIEDSYKKVIFVDGKEVTLDILDTAGQDDFAAIRATYMRQGQGFILVFAVNDPSSFDQIDKFQKDIKVTSGKEDIPIVVCGNKVDMPNRDISEDEARQYCESVNIPYFETSAKNNINVQESFMHVTRLMRKANPALKEEIAAGEKPNGKDRGDNGPSEASCNMCSVL